MRRDKFEHESVRLRKEHQELEQRLAQLDRRSFLQPAEEVERKRLQKLKLSKKDRMMALGVI